MFFAKVFIFASLAVSANALATPLVARHAIQHRAIAARVVSGAVPEPVAPVAISTPRKRANGGRCKPNPSSTPTPSPAAAAPVNAAPDPADEVPSSSSTPKDTPTPTPTPKAKPTPTPTPKTTTTKQQAPAPSPTKASGGNGGSGSLDGQVHTGDGTFYATGLGACGITNNDSDMIAAIAHANFDSFPGYAGGNPNNNPICGKQVTAHYQGKSVTVTITDRCGGCEEDALDFSPAAFDQLADPSIGRLHGVTWSYDN